jgi:hypothetical protein
MAVRASAISIPFVADEELMFRVEGSGVLTASGPFGGPINLSAIGPNSSPHWAQNVRTERAVINIFVHGRNASGSCGFTIKLGDESALSDPRVIMGPISVPASYQGLIEIPFDMSGQGYQLADPLWASISIELSGGAVCGGWAALGPRMK